MATSVCNRLLAKHHVYHSAGLFPFLTHPKLDRRS